MSSRQDVQEKLKVTSSAGGPVEVTRRSQAKYAVASSSVISSETSVSKASLREAASTLEVAGGFLLVRVDAASVVSPSVAPYLACQLEKGAVSQAPPDSAGLEGRKVLYVKSKAISYDSMVLVPWDAVLLLF